MEVYTAIMEKQNNGFNKFRPVVIKRASEEIFEQIRDLILSGELKQDERLPSEKNLIEMFQRSRPTIREAMRMLERSGYIRIVAGSSGAVVMKYNDKLVHETMQDAMNFGHISLAEMSEYRKVSETATVVWAALRATSEDIAAIRDFLDEMEANTNNHEEFVGMDPHFHKLLAAASKNAVSVTMNETFALLIRSFVLNKMVTMPPAAREKMCLKIHGMHKAIFEAVSERDAEKARQAMTMHLEAFASDLR